MDFSDPSGLLVEQVVDDLHRDGRHLFAEALSPTAASDLLADIRATRRFDASLFLSEEAFDAHRQPVHVDPRPGRNLADRFEDRLGFVEDAPAVVAALTALLGRGYVLLNRRIVCAVPARAMPAWLQRRLDGRAAGDLGAYVRPEMRDVAYFGAADFRQDGAGCGDRGAEVLALDVYLHPVGIEDAPLHVLDGSHALGAATHPLDLQRAGPAEWRYRNGAAGEAAVRTRVLIGETGFAALRHACTLHAAGPALCDRGRISLRCLFAPRPDGAGRLREVNAALEGRLGPAAARVRDAA